MAVWQRGAALFPQHTGLRERLQAHPLADNAPATSVSDVMEMAAVQPAYTLDGLVVVASGMQMDEARSGTALRRIDVLRRGRRSGP